MPGNPQNATRDISGSDVAIEVKGVLSGSANVRNVKFDGRTTRIPGGEFYSMMGQMIAKGGDVVGSVRSIVYIPSDPVLDMKVRVEWTRNAFGFWYRMDFGVGRGDSSLSVSGRMREIIRWVGTTAMGTVRVESMNRMFRKVKKRSVVVPIRPGAI